MAADGERAAAYLSGDLAPDLLKSRLDAAGSRAAGTLLGVQRPAYPELAIEFEATAVA